jgi:arylsulfatase A-like enzyme
MRSLTLLLSGVMGISPMLPIQAKDMSVRPNFLLIVADDLGFSDLGAFGGEIVTPNLDGLAYEGVRFTGFHTATWCAPTRAMLMSGTDPNLAFTGRGGWPRLRADVPTLAERLAEVGYRTLFSGKWHLGVKSDEDPHARGFHRSFALLEAEHNHFGGMNVTLPTTYTENGVPFTALPENFYSSDYFASRLIDFLRETEPRDGGHKPFFAYLAFTAPHGPLQARQEDIAKYHGRYDAGFDVLKEERLARQKKLGLLDRSVVPHEPLFWTGYPIASPSTGRWDTWTSEQRKMAARDMEIFAAMVGRLDQNVGRVLAALKETGELDDTVILFLSDNGAQGAVHFTEATYEATFKKYPEFVKELTGSSPADNRLKNRGSATSWVRYAPGWAEAATAPSWLYKLHATEGGTRVPAFLHLPGSLRRREIANLYLSAADVLPTFLDLAGVVPEPKKQGHASQPITGRSWVSWLKGESSHVYGPKDAIGTGMWADTSRSLRKGDWKITDVDGNGRWLLFNIVVDPGETRDLSQQYPERKAELLADYAAWAVKVDLSGTSSQAHESQTKAESN